VLIADRGYAHDSTRVMLRRRGVRHVIPERRDQLDRRAAKGSGGGRPPLFDARTYLPAEQCRGTLLQPTRTVGDLATRYAKRASIHRASLVPMSDLI
jgi:hypothetical protein